MKTSADLFDDVDGVVEHLTLEKGMHVTQENTEMSLTVTIRNDDGDTMTRRAVARSPRAADQRRLNLGIAVAAAALASLSLPQN